MQNLYAPDATFFDPVFLHLNSSEVKAMWEMLLTASKDLEVKFGNIVAQDDRVTCDWEAVYTFTLTGKRIHNVIHANFTLRDGRIVRHVDTFDLYRWSRMAFGGKGFLLGWTAFMQNQIRTKAKNRLTKFIEKAITAN